MKCTGWERILTFNRDDFARYGIEMLDPSVIGT
jgi:hypothetical protein